MELEVRVVYPELPVVAERAPHRRVSIGDSGGRCEVWAYDARTGTDRVVTARPGGTTRAAIDPLGQAVWWFDDDVTGVGVWRTQPFGGGTDRTALPGVPGGRPAGLAMALDGTVAAALSDDTATTVYLSRADDRPVQVARFAGPTVLTDLSADGTLLAVSGEPDAGDAVRVLSAGGTPVAVLAEPGGQLWALEFTPRADETALLLLREAGDRYTLAVWRPGTGVSVLEHCVFDTEITASWYPDGRRLLVRRDHHGRSTLFRTSIEIGAPLRELPTHAGSILAAGVQADNVLRYVWTDSATPPQLRAWPMIPEQTGPPPAPVHEIWAPGPGGAVHALVSLPERETPRPAVFLLHGGPYEAAMDAYDPLVVLFTRLGCAVVRVNFRGSTGYGPAWRRDVSDGVGLTQLRDIAAVRDEVVRTGIAEPHRTALAGESWGGYLALLAAGVQPELWCGIAAVAPVADYPAAFRDTTPAVRALDTRLFGGTPEQVPGAYRRASPLTYVDAVRAPLLIMAGARDPKCPPAQIETYAERLRSRCHPLDLVWTGHGHEAHDAAGRVEVISAVVRHLGVALGGTPAPATTAR